MDKPLLVVVIVALLTVFIAVVLVSRTRGGRPQAHRTRPRREDGSFVLMAGSDGGGSRKGSSDGDGRDASGSDGGGGDGGGGGGD